MSADEHRLAWPMPARVRWISRDTEPRSLLSLDFLSVKVAGKSFITRGVVYRPMAVSDFLVV